MSGPLLAEHAPGARVAFGRAGDKTVDDLRDAALRIAAALPPAAIDSQVLLVLSKDRFAMAAALLGVWHRGHAVALPPSSQRESIMALRQRPETVAMLHDTAAGCDLPIDALLAGAGPAAPAASLQLPQRSTLAVLFTSGSSGASLPCPKTGAQLFGEAAVLARLLGMRPGMRVVGTVQPTHLYGLLCMVLLPLCHGGAFLRETPLHAETIAAAIAEHGAELCVTVPLHVQALSTVDRPLLRSLRHVVCSTAALPARTAEAFAQQHGQRLTELLGATETGGMATRQQPGEQAWQPLPGVQIGFADDGALLVSSPFLDAATPQPWRSADLAVAQDGGGFLHLGRADGIVKVGGQRLALAAMEERLRQHPAVADAAVAALPMRQGRGHQLLAAVAAPDDLLPELKRLLLAHFPASVLPRRWAFVDELRREANGKLPRATLLRHFGLRVDGRALNRQLAWQKMQTLDSPAAHEVLCQVGVPADYAWFDGHFPGQPILAGAVQLKEIVLPLAARYFAEWGDVTELRGLKFADRIAPGDQLTVQLVREAANRTLRFAIRRADRLCTSGKLIYGEDA